MTSKFAELAVFLERLGFAGVMQSRKKDKNSRRIGNATFWNEQKFSLLQSEHRSRSLITKVQNAEGVVFVIANVHLQSGWGQQHEETRNCQLRSALTFCQQMAASSQPSEEKTHQNSYMCICGDFNSRLDHESETLLEQLVQNSFRSMYHGHAPREKFMSYAVTGYYDCLDHIWFAHHPNNSSRSSTPQMFHFAELLTSDRKDRNYMRHSGLPSLAFPSDHLPVGCLVRLNMPHKQQLKPPRIHLQKPAQQYELSPGSSTSLASPIA
jgi:mRNA deadenylase 3'-5' endonuclease subunit Ccr4